jgi:hypothetical protein
MKPFDDISPLDELRRFAAGEMSSEARARFELELKRDPELARLASDFLVVWRATASGLGPIAASRTSFDDLLARADAVEPSRHTWRRRAAAAAVCIALAAIGWAALRYSRSASTGVVELHSIPWNEGSSAPAENAAVPAVLASWSPVENGQIRWLDSLDEARAVSTAVSRPIFVYGYIDGCPICQGFQRNEFQDPEILALVDQSVPVRINLLELDQEEMESLTARRYPLLEMQNERGEILRTFPGQFAEVDMRAELARAVAGLAGPNWKLVNDLARRFLSARAAEANGRLADASGNFERLAAVSALPRFATAGNAGIARLAAAATRLVEEARTQALVDEPGARARFEADMLRFEGTPFEADLRAVARAWRDSGHFPRSQCTSSAFFPREPRGSGRRPGVFLHVHGSPHKEDPHEDVDGVRVPRRAGGPRSRRRSLQGLPMLERVPAGSNRQFASRERHPKLWPRKAWSVPTSPLASRRTWRRSEDLEHFLGAGVVRSEAASAPFPPTIGEFPCMR